MTLSVLQLNINGDNYLDTAIDFLQSHSFDLINLQEVSGINARFGNVICTHDCFAEIKEALKHTHAGELSITDRLSSDPTSYTGNATFYRKDFDLIEKTEIVMHKNEEPFHSDSISFVTAGRRLLDLKLQIEGKLLHNLNVHFAWGPTPLQMQHHTDQGKILVDHLKSVPAPYIFTGDFNLTQDQPLIQELGTLARNVSIENHITNTLNQRTHRVKELFPPGLAVDNIFVSKDILVKNFKVLEDLDLSDHFGLSVEVEL